MELCKKKSSQSDENISIPFETIWIKTNFTSFDNA